MELSKALGKLTKLVQTHENKMLEYEKELSILRDSVREKEAFVQSIRDDYKEIFPDEDDLFNPTKTRIGTSTSETPPNNLQPPITTASNSDLCPASTLNSNENTASNSDLSLKPAHSSILNTGAQAGTLIIKSNGKIESYLITSQSFVIFNENRIERIKKKDHSVINNLKSIQFNKEILLTTAKTYFQGRFKELVIIGEAGKIQVWDATTQTFFGNEIVLKEEDQPIRIAAHLKIEKSDQILVWNGVDFYLIDLIKLVIDKRLLVHEYNMDIMFPVTDEIRFVDFFSYSVTPNAIFGILNSGKLLLLKHFENENEVKWTEYYDFGHSLENSKLFGFIDSKRLLKLGVLHQNEMKFLRSEKNIISVDKWKLTQGPSDNVKEVTTSLDGRNIGILKSDGTEFFIIIYEIEDPEPKQIFRQRVTSDFRNIKFLSKQEICGVSCSQLLSFSF